MPWAWSILTRNKCIKWPAWMNKGLLTKCPLRFTCAFHFCHRRQCNICNGMYYLFQATRKCFQSWFSFVKLTTRGRQYCLKSAKQSEWTGIRSACMASKASRRFQVMSHPGIESPRVGQLHGCCSRQKSPNSWEWLPLHLTFLTEPISLGWMGKGSHIPC